MGAATLWRTSWSFFSKFVTRAGFLYLREAVGRNIQSERRTGCCLQWLHRALCRQYGQGKRGRAHISSGNGRDVLLAVYCCTASAHDCGSAMQQQPTLWSTPEKAPLGGTVKVRNQGI